MNQRFEGKTAIVTGGASGIGQATVRRLASEGATVLIADLNLAGAQAEAAAISRLSTRPASALAFDASDPASCRDMIDQAQAKLGRIDILCNIAGIMDWGHATDFPEAAWERMMRINLSSVFYVTQRALPALIESRGAVVNMASAAGLMGIAYSTAYCAAKAGVIGVTKSMAVEFASKGVRFNAVCPGGVKTPMHNNTAIPEGLDQKLLDRLWPKLGELCEPDEIAAGVAYLASSEARNITGSVLTIDGGQTAG